MLNKLLKAMIKLSAVCLTAPATLAVASTIYADYSVGRWIVAGACLVLVEGALLLGWQLLDSEGKTATSGQRGLYAALVITSYVVLWAVALVHGEGLAGIAFRATLGVLLAYSLMEAGILAGLRQDSAVSKDIGRDRHVRRHQRALAVKDAIAQLDSEYALKDREREQVVQQNAARLDQQHRQAMSNIRTKRDASIEGATQGYPMPIRTTRAIRDGKRAARKQQALDMILAARQVNPGISQQDLAALCGVSRATVGNYLAELRGNNGTEGQRQLSFPVEEFGDNGAHSQERTPEQ